MLITNVGVEDVRELIFEGAVGVDLEAAFGGAAHELTPLGRGGGGSDFG